MSAQKTAKPRVLIAGGASYLGLKLASSLLFQNCEVVVLDNLTSGSAANIEEFGNRQSFKFIKADIAQELPQDLGKFTHVYHLAGIEEYLTEAALTRADLLVNSAGTDNLLKFAKEIGAKFVLVSTLDVYFGIISQTSLENYFGPTRADFTHFSHHEAKRFAESLVASYFQNFSLDCAISRITQIYGPGMNLASNEVTARLIKQALTSDALLVPGDGLEVIHPTYIDDVVWGLVKVGFSKNTKGGIYNLVVPDEVKVLEFANRLKEAIARIDETKVLEITFEKEEKPVKFPIPKVEFARTERDLGWAPKVDLGEGLVKTLEYFLTKKEEKVEIKVEEQPIEAAKVPEVKKFQLPKILPTLPTISLPKVSLALPKVSQSANFAIFVLALLIFFLIIIPAGQLIVGTTFGFLSFQDARAALFKADFEKAESKAQQAKIFNQVASNGFGRLAPIFFIFGSSEVFQDLNQNFAGVNKALLGFSGLAEIGKLAQDLTKTVISGGDANFKEEISQLNLKFVATVSDFEQAKLDFGDFKLGNSPFFGQRAKELLAQIDQNLPNLKKGANFVRLLPEFLAIDGEKSYLALFQNNSELRPGGGFIGSYGIFEFKNGKLAPPVIDDVYNLDGQLKVKIPPPQALKTHLGVESLGLRDSNWHYDFPQNGVTAANFYQQVTGKKVDGVISVDVDAMAEVLSVLGPVKLEDYNEEITSQNLAERAEYYAEIGFFPGSTSKKDFLSSLARHLILKIQKGEQVNYSEMIKVFGQVANEKHLNFYFENPALATFFADVGWSGQIKVISTQIDGQTKTVTDFLALSEANVGANKSNRFVERKINLAPIILRDGDLITELTIEYKNNSPAPTWPGGNYKNYLRIVTPIGSKLEQLLISDQDVTPNVENFAEFDKQIFAVFLEIPAGEAKKVVVKYRPNYRIKIGGENATYSLLVQKQPGTGQDQVNIDLSYPGYLKAAKTNLPASFSEQKVNFTQKLSTDLDFKVEFFL